jgi:hypothetical protein
MSKERHVVKAYQSMPINENRNTHFIEIENGEEVKGVAPIVKFTIQSDPIGEVGINGCQAVDMLEYVGHLFKSLNDSFPCHQNLQTFEFIQFALASQAQRTLDRESRGVEGKNKV